MLALLEAYVLLHVCSSQTSGSYKGSGRRRHSTSHGEHLRRAGRPAVPAGQLFGVGETAKAAKGLKYIEIFRKRQEEEQEQEAKRSSLRLSSRPARTCILKAEG